MEWALDRNARQYDDLRDHGDTVTTLGLAYPYGKKGQDGKKPTQLALTWFAKRLTVKLGEHVLFDQVPLHPIPGKHRIGIATWGEAFRVEEIELRGPVRTR